MPGQRVDRNWLHHAFVGSLQLSVANAHFGNSAVSVINDQAGGVLFPTNFNRLLGSFSLTAVIREDADSPRCWARIQIGLVRSVPELLAAGIPPIPLTTDDADMSWVWRETRHLFCSRHTSQNNVFPQVIPVFQEGGGTAGGGLQDNLGQGASSWTIDWQLRGGKGTRIAKDVDVQFVVAIQAVPTVVPMDSDGTNWNFQWSLCGAGLYTAY